MHFISTMDVYSLAILVYFLRIVDVSLDTLRAISVIAGKKRLPFVLGFVEVLIWILAVSQVIARVNESIIVAVFYALGFATGNVLGVCIERVFSIGYSAVRIFSREGGAAVADVLREKQYHPVITKGEGDKGELYIIYTLVHSSNIGRLINTARTADPQLTYIIEPVKGSNIFRKRRTFQILGGSSKL